MKTADIQKMILAYLEARHKAAPLTPYESAGFLITQFGVVEAIEAIESKGLQMTSNYWNEVLNHLKAAL